MAERERITKTELAAKLGVSRPTLDKYLKEGFPNKITDSFTNDIEDKEYQKLLVENEIRLVKYTLNKLEEKLKAIDS